MQLPQPLSITESMYITDTHTSSRHNHSTVNCVANCDNLRPWISLPCGGSILSQNLSVCISGNKLKATTHTFDSFFTFRRIARNVAQKANAAPLPIDNFSQRGRDL
ncbi:uncharacterized protein MELLADRAFT_107676 [Melampsora larici-populina 98AG31]|uniref:Uncharacterized protein n=1 Tax=Melampsora larici-populina (strain 98AG31 / pathotype 3-4-7) TaxID=747676 RepID=F4RQE3_MELLP|nr:uncharacterized protein MELLADRAFT_107676 [Melampsora larici-populina 98AG31]EGG05423.1 hypothetical protein MELLADRAFT_107676 [Melampsora larici-populina 98AG31]